MASVIPVDGKWRAQVRRKGHKAHTKTFGTKILADKWARRIEADIDAGRAGVRPKSVIPIKSIIKDYRGHFEAEFGKNKESVLTLIETHIGDDDIFDLSADRLVRYIVKDRRISGVTASIDLTYLKGLVKFAKTMKRLPLHLDIFEDAREMLRMMNRLGRSNERDRRPTGDELGAIQEWCDVRSRVFTRFHVDFILDSAFRPPSEIVRLRRSLLNKGDRTIVIENRKDPRKKLGNHQTVPLLGRCMEIIERQPKDSEIIFPVNGKTWSTLFARACTDLGIEDLQLYDLRHEAISRLVETNKYSIPELMLITGHKDPKQLMRYTQLRAKNLHR